MSIGIDSAASWLGPPTSPQGSEIWGIVLAGGDGIRLRNLAGKIAYPGCPKQYAVTYEGRCLLRHTLERAELLMPPERIVTVVSRAHDQEVKRHLADRPPATVLAQPANRGTGVGVLLGLACILERAPGATVVVLPSDHFVDAPERFMEHVRLAKEAVDRRPGAVVLLGTRADSPDAEYGWIEPGATALSIDGRPLKRVTTFREKPCPRLAAALLARGALWNTMVLIARGAALLDLFARYLPDVLRRFSRIGRAIGGHDQAAVFDDVYRLVPAASFSEEILERNPASVLVLELSGVLWGDWGTPRRICRTLERIGKIEELRGLLAGRGWDPDAVLAETG